MQPGYPPPPPPGYGWPQQPAGYGYGYPPPKTNTPRTLGTLSMVFGGIIAALSLFSLLAGKQLGTFSVQAGQRAAFERYLEDLHSYTLVQSTVMLFMSAALFYIGMGQRGYKRWAVGASVKWGIAGVLVIVAQFIGAIVVAMPAMDRFIADIGHGLPQVERMASMMKVMTFVGLCFYLPYPLILISAFRKPENVEAMDEPKLPVASVHQP